MAVEWRRQKMFSQIFMRGTVETMVVKMFTIFGSIW